VLLTALAIAVAVTLIGVATAIAGNMSFQSGGVKVGSLFFDGVVIGVGSDVLEVEVTANAIVTLECTNKGGTAASGRNLIEVVVPTSATFAPDENGKVVVTGLTVEDPDLSDIQPSPSPKTAGCPSGKWTVSQVGQVIWTTVTVTATDLEGNVQAEATLVFDCTGITEGDCPQVSG
jgi:hypothetical protein